VTTKTIKTGKSLGKFSFNFGFVKILVGKLVKTTSAADRENNHQFGFGYKKS